MASRKFLVDIDMVKNHLLQMCFEVLAADPGSPSEGQVYWNSTIDALKLYTGAGWIILGRLDQLNAPTGVVSLNNQKITDLANPTADGDAANKLYVDNAIAGLNWKDSVRVATTAAGTLATDFENGDTVDGVTLATGDRILLKNQAAGAENGIYVVQASGAPLRATDADSAADIRQAAVFVEEGTTNAERVYVNSTNAPITLGTTALVFSQFGAGGGGSGTVTRVNADVGDGVSTTLTITHSFATRDIQVEVYRNTTPWDTILCDVARPNTNDVDLSFNVAPTSAQFRVVVLA